MFKQQETELHSRLENAWPRMQLIDQQALVAFAEASVRENPIKYHPLALVTRWANTN